MTTDREVHEQLHARTQAGGGASEAPSGVKPKHRFLPRMFSDEKEQEIVSRWVHGESMRSLGKEYGCSRLLVRKLAHKWLGFAEGGKQGRQLTLNVLEAGELFSLTLKERRVLMEPLPEDASDDPSRVNAWLRRKLALFLPDALLELAAQLKTAPSERTRRSIAKTILSWSDRIPEATSGCARSRRASASETLPSEVLASILRRLEHVVEELTKETVSQAPAGTAPAR